MAWPRPANGLGGGSLGDACRVAAGQWGVAGDSDSLLA